MRKRLLLHAAVVAGLAVFGTACSDNPSGSGPGSASAVVHDNPNSSGSQSPATEQTFSATSGSSDFSGSMSADVQVQVSADGSTWVDVGPPESNANVTLQSDSETTVATNATVESGTFSHVRVVLEDADATIESGSSFSGGGLILDVDVTLDLGGDGRVVIEKSVGDFQVDADSRTTIDVDMNSEAWVNQDNVEARAVAESEIESATSVTVR